jgi:hypothetical protein
VRVFQETRIEEDIGSGSFAITTLAEGVSPNADAGGGIENEVDYMDAMVTAVRARDSTVKLDPFLTPV